MESSLCHCADSIMDTLNVNREIGSDVWLCSWTPVLHHREEEEPGGYFQEKKIHINHIEIAEEISLKILVIRGLLLVCIEQDNTCLLGLKRLKIPRQGIEPSTWKERGLTAGEEVICQHL